MWTVTFVVVVLALLILGAVGIRWITQSVSDASTQDYPDRISPPRIPPKPLTGEEMEAALRKVKGSRRREPVEDSATEQVPEELVGQDRESEPEDEAIIAFRVESPTDEVDESFDTPGGVHISAAQNAPPTALLEEDEESVSDKPTVLFQGTIDPDDTITNGLSIEEITAKAHNARGDRGVIGREDDAPDPTTLFRDTKKS